MKLKALMRRSLKFGAATIAAFTLFVGVAWAATSITFSPTGLLEVPAFPYVTDVSGTFTTDDTEGLCINANGTDWDLWVEDASANVLATDSGSFLKTAPPNPTCPAGADETITLVDVGFPAAGTYTLKGTLKTIRGADLDLAEEDDLILQLEQEIVVDYPAAPSVAARLLDDAGVSHRYGSGKNGGNHVADVANWMGPGTMFDGVSKDDVEAYEDAVKAYLGL
jgi:hypothetical protein